MVERVIISADDASPFRVSVAGVDVNGAEFNNLIFDGNQPPFRVMLSGNTAVAGITWNNYMAGQNLSEGSPVVLGATAPAGQYNLWLSRFYVDFLTFDRPMFHVNNLSDGASSAICQSGGTCYFVPCSHEVGPPGAPTSPGDTIRMSYHILRSFF